MNLVLIGPRGCGKSSVGRELAARLGKKFVDTDTEVETLVGMSLSRFVALKGWEVFRQKESEVVRSVASQSTLVIACGGGVVLDATNRAHLGKSGIIVYLFASIPALLSRISDDMNTTRQRPSLKKGMSAEEELYAIMAEREQLYKQCSTIAIDTTDLCVSDVCDQIIQFLEIKR